MEYRREIDGLRALAVMPVLFFHAGFDTFSGGFIGVDVFFVISGYLITTIILSEKSGGIFSFANFYKRRARRILPALYFMLLVCLPFAWMWLLPKHLTSFSESLQAVALYVSNIYFWNQSGYWEPASELKPLIHTWSLGVEEQFYAVFPLLVVIFWCINIRRAKEFFLLITVSSLLAAEFFSDSHPEATFYLLPTRLWELTIGSSVAAHLIEQQNSGRTASPSNPYKEILCFVGIVMIAYAVFTFDKSISSPGLYMLIPTIGAALIILYSSNQTKVGRLLSSKPVALIGLISYSAYLWHLPLFAFARHRSLVELEQSTYLILVLATLVIAYFSWRYIERPFRDKNRFSGKFIFFALVLGGTTLFLVMGTAAQIGKGWSTRLDPMTVVNEEVPPCAAKEFSQDQICTLVSNTSKKTILIGDSHAGAISGELKKSLGSMNVGLLFIYKNGCPPILNVYRADHGPEKSLDNGSCHLFNKQLYEYIIADAEIEYVVLSARWALSIEGARFDNNEGGREYSKYPPHLDLVENGRPLYHPSYEHKKEIADAFADSIGQLLKAGKKVILVYQVPEAGWNVPDYLSKYQLIHSMAEIRPETGSTSYKVFNDRNKNHYKAFDAIGDDPNLLRIYPDSIFCNNSVPGRCVVHSHGTPYYKDDDHLSAAGAELVVEKITEKYRDY